MKAGVTLGVSGRGSLCGCWAMLGLPVGFGSHREMFVEEGLSRDALGASIPLLLLSPSHEDTGADFLAKG